MKPEETLVIMPMQFAWNWHNTFEAGMARVFARRKHPVWVMWDFRWMGIGQVLRRKVKVKEEIAPGIWEIHPVYFVPFVRFRIIRRINQISLRFQIKLLLWWLLWGVGGKRYKQVLMWMFPLRRPIKLCLAGKKVIYIYDVADGWSFQDNVTRETETEILGLADQVLAGSQIMAHLLRLRHDRVHLVPMGFEPPSSGINIPKIKDHKRPIIGYAGGINSRLDFSLLIELVRAHPEWDFEFYGPVQAGWGGRHKRIDKWWADLKTFHNVRYGGNLRRKELWSRIANFRVGIIPYDTSIPMNLFSFSMKLFEYWYVGLPVVATAILELITCYPEVKIGKSAAEWGRLIEESLDEGETCMQKDIRKRLALKNRWSKKYLKIKKYVRDLAIDG